MLQDVEDATDFGEQTKRAISRAVRALGRGRLLLSYSRPIFDACFLRDRSNAVARGGVLMEARLPGYVATFVLS